MKRQLVVVLGLLLTTIVLVVVLATSPDQRLEPQKNERPAPPRAPAPVLPTPADSPREMPTPPTAPTPLPTDDERAAIEERIEGSVDRLRLGDRLRIWWYSEKPKLSADDYEKARGLYLRHLGNFALIETARFRVETYRVSEDGVQQIDDREEIFWTPSSERVEVTYYEDGREIDKGVAIRDGDRYCEWPADGEHYCSDARHWHSPGDRYLHRGGLALMRESRPMLGTSFTNCELDDGTTGFSRLWTEGYEQRFDTATGMMSEERWGKGNSETYTYQNVNGIWFPLETLDVMRFDPQRGGPQTRTRRIAFSHVVLNEPIDPALFDVDNPHAN